MRIYTSYYANMRHIPEDIVQISIAGKAPKWYNGLEYKKLAPKFSFFNEWKTKGLSNEYYIEHFNNEVLSLLNANNVLSDLERLSGGKDCVLLCYESPDNFCHRHLVANWLENKLGIDVHEFSKHIPVKVNGEVVGRVFY